MYREDIDIQNFKIQQFKDTEEEINVIPIHVYNDIKIDTFYEKLFISNMDTYALLTIKEDILVLKL